MTQHFFIRDRIQASISVKQQLLEDVALLEQIDQFAHRLTYAFQEGKKALFCGNGGSAGDAQHIAAELSGRFYKNRPPLYAEALHVNSSYLTAVANDFGYDEVYARMVEATGRAGDVLVAISTSGNSPNVIRAIEAARLQNMIVIGLTGAGGGAMASLCDVLIDVPSTDTPRIQESHILIGHIVCEIVENRMFE